MKKEEQVCPMRGFDGKKLFRMIVYHSKHWISCPASDKVLFLPTIGKVVKRFQCNDLKKIEDVLYFIEVFIGPSSNLVDLPYLQGWRVYFGIFSVLLHKLIPLLTHFHHFVENGKSRHFEPDFLNLISTTSKMTNSASMSSCLSILHMFDATSLKFNKLLSNFAERQTIDAE